MKTTLLTSALAALLLPACIVEGGSYDYPGDRGPSYRQPQPLSRWGEACYADRQCVAGHSCTDGSCEPTNVGIYPVNALVAPGMSDGREWDSERYLPRWIWDDLERARGRGVDALYDFMDEQLWMGWSRPDPYGYGFLSLDGYRYDDRYTVPLVERGQNQLDVFDVRWPGTVGWRSVPFTTSLSVALDLYDEDRRDDESIGFVELDFWALREALYQGGVVYFDTYEATGGQLLLVGVRVVPE